MERIDEVVAAIAGAGWHANFLMEDGTLVHEPVVCWVVLRDGIVEAHVSDGGGGTEACNGVLNFKSVVHVDNIEHQAK